MKTSFNQKIIDSTEPILNADHLGFLRGLAVFETLRTYTGRIFRLQDHLERLFSSAEKIKLKSPWSKIQIEDCIQDLLSLSTSDTEKRFRIILADRDLIVQMMELEEKPKEYYEKGVKLVSYEGIRPIPQAKILGCITCYLANEYARQNHAYDSLLINPYSSQVTECSYANLFWVKGGQLFTTNENILEGVTRRTVMELAGNCQFKSINLEALKKADEVFITQTTSGILPVSQVDNESFKTGEVTKGLIERFNNLVWANNI